MFKKAYYSLSEMLSKQHILINIVHFYNINKLAKFCLLKKPQYIIIPYDRTNLNSP